MPPRLIAVDKAGQQLYLMEGGSGLRVAGSYICTTGQASGDKLVEGDLKTPEGVYFVVRRIGSGLDYFMYGNEAYTLNFPNPVDKLRRKTGYGIWIHGKGEELRPLQTQGCVAMDNGELAVLGKLLIPGTPVSLAETLSYAKDADPADRKKVAALKKNVHAWAEAWAGRSASMFDFYDKEAYSIAQSEAFSAFQAQKERLFKSLPWIRTTVHDVQVLPGPGYWVTWFFQEYTAPNLSTRGVRRLYWQENSKGEFKIVGMEWIPGMTTSLLLASAEDSHPSDEGRQEGGGQLISEEQATPRPGALAAVQGASVQGASARDAAGRQEADAPQQGIPAEEPVLYGGLDHVEDPRFGKMAEPPQAASLRAGKGGSGTQASAQSSSAQSGGGSGPAAGGSSGAIQTAGLNLPPALPSQGLAAGAGTQGGNALPVDGGKAAASTASASLAADSPAARDAGEAPSSANASTGQNPDEEQKAPAQDTGKDANEDIPVPGGEEALAATGRPQIAASAASAASAETAAATAVAGLSGKELAAQAGNFVENWRLAWQSGDVRAYTAFYSPGAVQGARTGAKAIREHKTRLWARVAPEKVVLGDVRVSIHGDTATVTMTQEYTDAKGGGDKGIKTLLLERSGNTWQIAGETWSAAP
jgi:murein L,D-transpeptidase YafK